MPHDAGVHQSCGNPRLCTRTSKFKDVGGWHMTFGARSADVPQFCWLMWREERWLLYSLLADPLGYSWSLSSDNRDAATAPLTGGWQWQKGLLCASHAPPPPHRLGLFFSQSIHLCPAVSALLGKNAPAPGMVLIMMVWRIISMTPSWLTCMVSGKYTQARIQAVLGPETSHLADFQLMED